MRASSTSLDGEEQAGRGCAVPALLLILAPAFAAAVLEQNTAAAPALFLDRHLQGAPRPWILWEEVLRAALLKVDHQEVKARMGAL